MSTDQSGDKWGSGGGSGTSGGSSGARPSSGRRLTAADLSKLTAADENALALVRQKILQMRQKKELTDTEMKLLDKCKQAQFTGTLTVDAVVASMSYFALSALGRRIPAVARHQSMGTIMCALVAHDWVQRRNADTCAKVFLASPNPAAAMLRDAYRGIAPDSKLLEFVDGVAGRLAAQNKAGNKEAGKSVGAGQAAQTSMPSHSSGDAAHASDDSYAGFGLRPEADVGLDEPAREDSRNRSTYTSLSGNAHEDSEDNFQFDSESDTSNTFDPDAYFGRGGAGAEAIHANEGGFSDEGDESHQEQGGVGGHSYSRDDYLRNTDRRGDRNDSIDERYGDGDDIEGHDDTRRRRRDADWAGERMPSYERRYEERRRRYRGRTRPRRDELDERFDGGGPANDASDVFDLSREARGVDGGYRR